MSDSPDLDLPRPSLDRESGRISFPPTADVTAPENLFLFLRGAGVQAAMDESPRPAIQLLGVPDLDAVETLIQTWGGGTVVLKRGVPPPPRATAGTAGRVRVINAVRGRATVEVPAAGFTVIELLADQNVRVGD